MRSAHSLAFFASLSSGAFARLSSGAFALLSSGAFALLSLGAFAGCSLHRIPILPADASVSDAGLDAARADAAVDGGMDVGSLDTGIEADAPMTDASDAGMDGGLDAPSDGGVDAPTDSGLDAGADAGVDAGVDAPCVPGCSDSSTLRGCGGGGTVTVETCSLGCLAAPAPHCAEMFPANVADSFGRVAVTPAIVVSTTERIDTTACTWARSAPLTGTLVASDGGSGSVCLFVVASLEIQAAGVVHGSGTAPLVIVSMGDISISGGIGVDSARSSGLGAIVGAGSTSGGNAGGNGGSSGFDDGGGGGGGFGAGGGRGADGGSGGGAGAAAATAPTLIPLRSGAPGGRGAGPSTASGGAGGGVLQLTALGRLTIRGYVGASGAGGEGGRQNGIQVGAGGGGGSGGGLLLEAQVFALEGGVLNIAGGGGGGGGGNCSAGADGIDDPTGRAVGSSACDGNGGAGGAGSGGAFQAGEDGLANNNGGGGGGGAGQVVLRTPDGILDLSSVGTVFNPTYATSALRYTVGDVSRR